MEDNLRRWGEPTHRLSWIIRCKSRIWCRMCSGSLVFNSSYDWRMSWRRLKIVWVIKIVYTVPLGEVSHAWIPNFRLVEITHWNVRRSFGFLQLSYTLIPLFPLAIQFLLLFPQNPLSLQKVLLGMLQFHSEQLFHFVNLCEWLQYLHERLVDLLPEFHDKPITLILHSQHYSLYNDFV